MGVPVDFTGKFSEEFIGQKSGAGHRGIAESGPARSTTGALP
jgi:hypothetical protein